MAGIIDNLELFNRKERFYLVGKALGNPTFKLDQQFRSELSNRLSLVVPEKAFCAMDYHLDWIYASLFLSFDGGKVNQAYPNSCQRIQATQEDVDMLISYLGDNNVCHMIIVEAKGVLNWNNPQMNSKAKRLRDIFGESGNEWPGVSPHFVLVSRREPKKLKHGNWPSWMRPDDRVTWIEMPIPNGRGKVTRCDEHGNPSLRGVYWKVETE